MRLPAPAIGASAPAQAQRGAFSRSEVGSGVRSFDHIEVLRQGLFINSESQAGSVFIEIDESIFGLGLALEDVPEQFVSDFDIDDGEVLSHRRIQACHYYVIVMHLSGVRNNGNRMRLGEHSNLARLANAPDPIGVELNVVNGPGIDQIAESVNGEFVLTPCNGNR